MRAALRARADPSKAEGMRAYMKSVMPYLGVPTTPLTAASRAVFDDYPLHSFDEWRETILALWHAAEFREERYAALALLGERAYRPFSRSLQALPLCEELIVSGAWWDLVDGVATHRIRELLEQHPIEMREVLLRWCHADDHWLRRTSIICQVGLKRATDSGLLFACIEPSLGERDFFLRKGIGWALREYGKVAPEVVAAYVLAHEERLSPLSRREALKYVSGA